LQILNCHEEEENLRRDREVRRERARPLWPLTRRGLDPIKLAYDKVVVIVVVDLYSASRSASNALCQQSCSRAYCYTELAISSPSVAETIASTHSTNSQMDGQAEWIRVAWINVGTVDPSKVITNLRTNRAGRSLT